MIHNHSWNHAYDKGNVVHLPDIVTRMPQDTFGQYSQEFLPTIREV